MTPRRLYTLIIICIIIPWFFPGARDTLGLWDAQTGVTARLREYQDVAAPATAALIKLARKNVQTVINGVPVTRPTGTGSTGSSGAVPEKDELLLKNGHNTLDSAQVEAILAEYGSPVQGYGYSFVEGYKRTGIDDAWIMAMFIHESTAGKFGVAAHTKSSGNIKWTHGEAYGAFQVYNDWNEGIQAHFDLLNDYAEGRAPSGVPHPDIISALNEWAPSEDNNNQNLDDPTSYPNAVLKDVRAWRQVNNPRPAEQQPAGSQGVAIGSSGSVEPWPGFLASQAGGPHDGARDFGHPEGTEVRAHVNGSFLMTGHYDDAAKFGDYFMFLDDQGREWYFGHLKNVNPSGLKAGERVLAGMVIGTVGWHSGGSHTHLQLRVNGVLTDPGPILEELHLGEPEAAPPPPSIPDAAAKLWGLDPKASDREKLVAYAMTKLGQPYQLGAKGPNASDCSGFTKLVYQDVLGIDIGNTTFDQRPKWKLIDQSQLKDGDLWFGKYPADEHTGIVADVDKDGKFDLIQNGLVANEVNVEYDFLSKDLYTQHTIDFRTVLDS